ncbi:hypothetical protein [Flavobacterium sp. 140616W15]|uniref:hypothetical protein n=1 Tax=Flavobacterium sp. 140616W15 TaxID=2478552 RepID=UPI000F0BDCA0|nr:hypothetical protein [Flavobacterium sp. 140616W15]AYN03522.1 hypothetical protein EAG11_04555 [Flavobacterium sp. 140616W15]
MVKLNYKNYQIEIFNDSNYTINSIDNLKVYDTVFFQEKKDKDKLYSTSKCGIIVKKSDTKIASAIICESGSATAITEKSFIIEDDRIWICVCNKVYCLEIPSLNLVWRKEIDFITNFSIHKIQDDFIIHGELDIKRITKDGETIWSFGGRNIWVNQEGRTEFNIENNQIHLFDFESNEYILDFNGETILDNPKPSTEKNWMDVLKIAQEIKKNKPS